ncbi:FAD-dependent monooxygenase [Georgenia yuyongxinii]
MVAERVAAGPYVDVLVVGAGPTGLALAAELRAHGTSLRLIDRLDDRAHESRALALQPRTLEVLARLDLADELVARGNRTVRVELHAPRRTTRVPLFDLGLEDTAYPFLLFLSQAVTEEVLAAHLQTRGIQVERGVSLAALSQGDHAVTCRLRHGDGGTETVRARFVVGCDGAHSTVRRLANIAFAGATYPQRFVLADLEADGAAPDAAHVYLAEPGMLFLFPLGRPATWRLLAMRPPDGPPTDLASLQELAVAYRTGLRLRDPVWTTDFRLHVRGAARYRAGRVFLAGDAAHIHSPAGAQGMNTGIQDAANLGWKLALVAAGVSPPALLDTYQAERAPVGRQVLRMTDRAFRAATSTRPAVRMMRTRLAPVLIPVAVRAGGPMGVRTIAQLRIGYRRSALAAGRTRTPRRGPRPGDRLPDAPLDVTDRPRLHDLVRSPAFHLLLCGPPDAWPAGAVTALAGPRLVVHRLGGGPAVPPTVLRRLGVRHGAGHLLVRPDGHVAVRGGTDLSGVRRYLDAWLPGT